MPGPAPKPPEQRQRRNATVPMTDLPSEGTAGRVPPLPGAKDLRAETRRWYRTWARSPQASQFTVTDWQRLHMLAPLVDSYFADPKATLMAEIRANETMLGAAALDRLRLRWQITEKPPEAVAGSSPRSRPDPRRLQAV